MGFFSVLGDIRRNKDNFKKWEEHERDNDAKRRALYAKGVGKERLEEAKRRGDVIIDVITQMDQHSENVAEDVEQIVQPLGYVGSLVGLAGGAVFGYLGYGKRGLVPKSEFVEKLPHALYKNAFSGIQNEINEIAEKNNINVWKLSYDFEGATKGQSPQVISRLKELVNLLPKWSSSEAETILSSKNLEPYKKYLTDDSIKQLTENYIPEYNKLAKKASRYGKIAIALTLGLPVLGFIGGTLASANIQLRGSRIARWQSREQLKDEKNFVVFTPEQIEEAKANLKKNEKPLSAWEKIFGRKEKKSAQNRGFWNNWWHFFADTKAYNRWKANDKDDSKLVKRELSSQDKQNALKDKELIQRITRKINNKAEEYSEDMETASAVIFSLPIVSGTLIGLPAEWLMEKTGIAKRISDSILKKNAPQEYLDLIKKQSTQEMNVLKKCAGFCENIPELGKMIEQEAQAAGKAVPKGLAKAWRMIKVLASQTPATRKFASFIGISALTSVVTMYLGLKLQKNAARAGRFVAREEFKDNPQEFLSYTDEEMKQVLDVKGKKPTMLENFQEWIFFLPRCVKNSFRYEKWKKTTYKNQKALRDELVKNTQVSDKQLKDAKNLQNKIFNTFEKVDEKSQSYSEHMEAANEMATPLIYAGGFMAAIAPLPIIGLLVAKGKISIAKLLDWFTSIMAKLGGSKWGQAVQKEGIRSLTQTIQNMPADKIDYEKIGSKLGVNGSALADLANQVKKGLSLFSTPIKDLVKNSNVKIDELFKGNFSKYIVEFLTPIKDYKLKDIASLKINEIIAQISSSVPKEMLEKYGDKTLGEILTNKKLSKIFDFNKLLNEYGEDSLETILRKKNILKEGQKFANLTFDAPRLFNIDADKIDVNKSVYQLIKENLGGKISGYIPSTAEIFSKIRSMIKLAPESWIQQTLGKISDKRFYGIKSGKFDKQYIIKILNKLEKVIEKSKNSGLKDEISKLFAAMAENPEKTMAMLINNPEKLLSAFNSKTMQNTMITLGISHAALMTTLSYCLASYFASMQKDAGRLGVMKALEELKDYRYYADEVSPTAAAQSTPAPQKTEQSTSASQTAQPQQVNKEKPAEQKLLKNYVKYVPKSAA